MNLSEFPLTSVLWTLTIILKGWIVAAMFVRGHYKKLPAFATWITFSLAKSLVLYFLAGLYPYSYARAYYFLTAIATVFMLWVITEVFVKVFTNACSVFRTWLPKLVRILHFGAIFLALFFWQLPVIQRTPLADTLGAIDRAVAMLLLAAFGLMALLSNYLGLVWGQRIYGIVVGLLFYRFVDLFVCTMNTISYSTDALNVISSLAFLITECVWLVYLTMPDPAKSPITVQQIKSALEQLRGAV